MDPISYKISPALESHISFIYNSSLRSLQGTFPLYLIDQASYYRVYHDIIEKAIKDLGVLVAHNPDEPDHILGYIIGNSTEIAYVYVKQDYRGLGIATDLIKNILYEGVSRIDNSKMYSLFVKYRLLTRSGAGLLRYLNNYVLQTVDFGYELPSEVKKNAVRKEEEQGQEKGQREVIHPDVLNPPGGKPDVLFAQGRVYSSRAESDR